MSCVRPSGRPDQIRIVPRVKVIGAGVVLALVGIVTAAAVGARSPSGWTRNDLVAVTQPAPVAGKFVVVVVAGPPARPAVVNGVANVFSWPWASTLAPRTATKVPATILVLKYSAT